MHRVLRILRKRWKLSLILLMCVSVIGIGTLAAKRNAPEAITGTVEIGTVQRIASVSGTLTATQTARLAFPVTGVVESIRITEGTTVAPRDELAVLAHNDLKADYEEAAALLQIAQADYDTLIAGLRPEERALSETAVQSAEQALAHTIREYTERVESAYRTLLSTDLIAEPIDKENRNTPPTITGTYTCAEGSYTFRPFRSDTKSGYSYRLSGLESGTFPAYTDTPAPLGACGLMIQFTAGEAYATTDWTVAIPNTQSASYVTNLNAYNLARVARENAVQAAEQTLTEARENETLDIAPPRDEAIVRAEAQIEQALARMASVRARMDDHILTAPFQGVVTSIEPTVGETVGTEPVITVLSTEAFELTALIPEIEVTRVQAGQKARVVFDARQEETLHATVVRVSPLAREINGVSYFEATLTLDATPEWLRGGLNADIDIILESREQVSRIPQRFLSEENGVVTALVRTHKTITPTPISILFRGNDGFVAITGLEPGSVVVAP